MNTLGKIYHTKKHSITSAIDHSDVNVSSLLNNQVLKYDSATSKWINATNSASGANTALSNLSGVAINTSLISDTDDTDNLGSNSIAWKMGYINNVTFLDTNSESWNLSDFSLDYYFLADELGTKKFNVSSATTGSARTVTLTQPDGNNLEFVIDDAREEHSGTTLSKDMTAFAGTDAVPKSVYTYVDINAGVPRLTASNTDPDGSIEHVDGVYEIVGAVGASSTNVYATRNIRAFSKEKIEKILDRFIEDGMKHLSGMVQTVSANSFAITSGTAMQSVEDVSTPALTLDGATDNQFAIQSDGTFKTYNTFQIDQYSDGVAFATTEYMRARIGVVINNPEGTSARLHIVPQNGATVYTKAKDAWRDKSGQAVIVPLNDIVANSFVAVADIVIFNNAGTYTLAQNPDTLLYFSDVRKGGLFGTGGGGGTVTQNLWETFNADTGSAIANTSTDTFTVTGGASITTSISGDVVTITNDAPNVDQNLFRTFSCPSGTNPVADSPTDTLTFSNGSGISITGTAGTDTVAIAVDAAQQGTIKKAITFTIDGGGSAITTGEKTWVRVPYSGTITGYELTADVSGDIVLDIWKDTYANFPPTVADTITASAKPTLSAALKAQDNTLTGWTTGVSAGDYLKLNVDSVATVTKIVLSLQVDVTGT